MRGTRLLSLAVFDPRLFVTVSPAVSVSLSLFFSHVRLTLGDISMASRPFVAWLNRTADWLSDLHLGRLLAKAVSFIPAVMLAAGMLFLIACLLMVLLGGVTLDVVIGIVVGIGWTLYLAAYAYVFVRGIIRMFMDRPVLD